MSEPGVRESPETHSLRDYLNILWRRKWVIVLIVALTTAAAFLASSRQPKVYEASADLIYERQVEVSSSITGQGYSDANERTVQLLSVGSIVASPDMQARAAGVLESQGYADPAYELASEPVTADAAGATSAMSSVVRITASSHDPELSAAVANAYAVAFVDYRRQMVKAQFQRGIDVVGAKMDAYPPGAHDTTEYLVLQQRLQDLQLLRDTATGNFRVLVPAEVPGSPSSPKPVQSALLGFGVGLIVAIGLVVLLEQFDTRLRRPEDVALIFKRPVLGRLPRIPQRLLSEGAVVALRHPDGEVAEALRVVRTNLEFIGVDESIRSAVVTSCVPGEGKSLTLVNLAVALAMGGKKVVVVDADLRRPRQHTYFSLRNDRGVSTVATGRSTLEESLQPVSVAYLESAPVVRDFAAWAGGTEAQSRLYVLTSGPIPPNPGEIVSSQRFSDLIEELTGQADMVLVDSPAMLPVGDTAAIAPKVGGVVFLVDMQVARRPQVVAAAEQLQRLPTRVLGIVVRADRQRGGSGYGSGYRYAQYTENGARKRAKGQAQPARTEQGRVPAGS